MGHFNSEVIPGVGGTLITTATTVTGGTVDYSPTYEPELGVAIVLGTAVAAFGSAIAYLHQSNDGSTWGTVGSVVTSAAGTSATNTAHYGALTATQRYIRAHLQTFGSNGTVTAAVALAVKPRTVD